MGWAGRSGQGPIHDEPAPYQGRRSVAKECHIEEHFLSGRLKDRIRQVAGPRWSCTGSDRAGPADFPVKTLPNMAGALNKRTHAAV